jgi:hypothetical protein
MNVINLTEPVIARELPWVIPSETIVMGYGVTLLATAGDHTKALITSAYDAHDIHIYGLEIDCNNLLRMGIVLCGSNISVHDCTVRNHISPTVAGVEQEAFAILLTNHPSSGPSSDALIDNCHVRDFKGNYDGGLVISGRDRIDRGIIRHSSIVGSGLPTSGHDMDGIIAAELVHDCRIESVAVGAYTEGLQTDMTIRNCTFKNIRQAAAKINLERAQPSFTFTDNQVHLAGGTGVLKCATIPLLDDLHIARNTWTGTGKDLDIKRQGKRKCIEGNRNMLKP